MRQMKPFAVIRCAAAKGDVFTRLSFLVMGAGCFRCGQLVRGLLYLLSEVFFVIFLRSFALPIS